MEIECTKRTIERTKRSCWLVENFGLEKVAIKSILKYQLDQLP